VADERIPVLFDTDIGSDIDDAVALASRGVNSSG